MRQSPERSSAMNKSPINAQDRALARRTPSSSAA
jgi:hypothetical protein